MGKPAALHDGHDGHMAWVACAKGSRRPPTRQTEFYQPPNPENALAEGVLNWFSTAPVARMVELADTLL